MSHVADDPGMTAVAPSNGDGDAHAHGHDPHLAHHFDTLDQQYQSSKLGMWVFLGTEILMFGGLFCAYSVYRHNHPEVFEYAHKFLNRWLGGLNTIVLITSSLTMAWGVRASQMGNQKLLRLLLGATIIGGYIFLGIKAIEYEAKWKEGIFVGHTNQFYMGKVPTKEPGEESEGNEAEAAKTLRDNAEPGKTERGAGETKPDSAAGKGAGEVKGVLQEAKPGLGDAKVAAGEANPVSATQPAATFGTPPDPIAGSIDGNAGTADEAKIKPPPVSPSGLAAKVMEAPAKEHLNLSDLDKIEQKQVYTFFGVYFFMTGLHGVHVLVGMALITWILYRSLGRRQKAWFIPLIPLSVFIFFAYLGFVLQANGLLYGGLILAAVCALVSAIRASRVPTDASADGEFGPTYFTPVDLVGLYWHIVDLIWIFLFPLLYLIH